MNYLFLRFPKFKEKAVTLSYDDCVFADRKLIEIMTENGLKGTFNINSGLFGETIGDRHLTAEEVKALYLPSGNEVAVHGLKHASLPEFDSARQINEIFSDRKNLEKLLGTPIRGMAYANHVEYSSEVIDVMKKCGILYARTIHCSENFNMPNDWYKIQPTCSDLSPNALELADKFVKSSMPIYYWDRGPKLFYLYGHSRFTDERHAWDKFEQLAGVLGNRNDIWYATNMEIYEYVRAYNRLEFGVNGDFVYNPSAIDVYLDYYESQYIVPAGKTTQLKVVDYP